MKNSILALILILLSGSAQNRRSNNSIETIDIYNAFNAKKTITLSSIVQSVEYIPLETRSDIVLTTGFIYQITNEHIIAFNNNGKTVQILMFERKSGKYIKEIAKAGRGPNEYRNPVRDCFNIYNKVIYANGNNRDIISYNLDGKYLESFKLPELDDPAIKGGKRFVFFSTYLKDDVFVYYVPNTSGFEKRKIILFSRDSIIKEYPNYLSWERKNLNVSYGFGNSCDFFRFDNSLFFKELLNDTVFQVTKEKLDPLFVFSAGKLSFPYSKREEFNTSDKYQKCLVVSRLMGNSGFLFFELFCDEKRYFSFYDKKMKRTTISDTPDASLAAIVDDINGFMPLSPQQLTPNNEMVFYLEAGKIKKWIDANPSKAKSLWGKFPWLKNITEMDNPVIVIAKCKG
jgi:hypothetical protein